MGLLAVAGGRDDDGLRAAGPEAGANRDVVGGHVEDLEALLARRLSDEPLPGRDDLRGVRDVEGVAGAPLRAPVGLDGVEGADGRAELGGQVVEDRVSDLVGRLLALEALGQRRLSRQQLLDILPLLDEPDADDRGHDELEHRDEEGGVDVQGAEGRDVEVVEEHRGDDEREHRRARPAEVRGDHHRRDEERRREETARDRLVRGERDDRRDDGETPSHRRRQLGSFSSSVAHGTSALGRPLPAEARSLQALVQPKPAKSRPRR